MLYIVPTPLGNLSDVSDRVKETLKSVDFIIAENPSQTHKLLQLLSLPKKEVVQFAQHNESKMTQVLCQRLSEQAVSAALVSDAGMPAISDPGFKLVRAIRQQNTTEITALPGPNAAITALAASGLPTDKFLFIGFLQKSEFKVVQAVTEAQSIAATLVCYESPQRITKTIGYIAAAFPEHNVVIAREISKLHEEYITGTSVEVLEKLEARQNIKGEITLLVSSK
jgi:16S rRNA (cytidine1402-2'-O)-methyltransferase